jgi:hypothetical protein
VSAGKARLLRPQAHTRRLVDPQFEQQLFFCYCSVHTVDCHSPALDCGFRRYDATRQAISWIVMPTKVGAFRYPGLFDDCPE